MTCKVGIDFDGVCTDISLLHSQRVDTYEYLFAPFSITISEPRVGIVELISAIGLFADLYIITSRPIEDKGFIDRWLVQHNLDRFFHDVICCGCVSKQEGIDSHDINLLIDDNPVQVDCLKGAVKGVLWGDQRWSELLKEVFKFLVDSGVPLKIGHGSQLIDFRLATDLGASQVFLLEFSDRQRYKLRVCFDNEMKERIIRFAEACDIKGYWHVPTVVAHNGLAVLKTYVEGKSISILGPDERLKYIAKTGSALARLHSIRPNSAISDLRFKASETEECLLVFSADNFNTVVSPDGEVYFIDLEACNSGPRWIDFCWAERLLCLNQQEIKAFHEGYFQVSTEVLPSAEDTLDFERHFKLWLSYHLHRSKKVHASDSNKVQLISDTFDDIWDK